MHKPPGRLSWQQPGPGAQLDRSNPLMRGLVDAWLLNAGAGKLVHSSVTTRQGILSAGAFWNGGASGVAADFSNNAVPVASYIDCGAPGDLTGAKACTIELLFYLTSSSANHVLFAQAGVFSCEIDSNVPVFIPHFSGFDLSTAASGLSVALGRWYRFFGTYDGNKSHVWLDTALSGNSISTSGGAAFIAGTGNRTIGALSTHSSGVRGRVAHALVWNRTLSRAEIQERVAKPYGMFLPELPRRAWFFAPSGDAFPVGYRIPTEASSHGLATLLRM